MSIYSLKQKECHLRKVVGVLVKRNRISVYGELCYREVCENGWEKSKLCLLLWTIKGY